jgi:hypothetical protein
MRFKLTIFLLLANLAVFFLLWRLNQPAEIVARPAGPIPKEFDIDHIVIDDHTPDGVRELTRDHNNIWRLVKPVQWLASDSAVANLINQLQFLDEQANFSLEDLKKSDQGLKDFGLDKPVAEITVFSGARTAKLRIGNHAQFGNRLYVMNPADGLVRVVAQELLNALDLPLDELREKRLFTMPIFSVRSLSINAQGTGSAPTNSFTRFVCDDLEQWRLDTPFSCVADSLRVKSAITLLENLHADSFVSATDAADPARLGLTTPTLKIDLKGDSTQQTFLLGNEVEKGLPENGYYAKLADSPTVVVVKVEDALLNLLRNSQDSLRERQFLEFSPEKISTISVHFLDTAEVQMQMLENRSWQIKDRDATGAPTFIAADSGIIQAMLNGLHQLSAKNFASDAPTSDDLQNTFNLKTPQWRVTLQTDQTSKPITLDIGIGTATTPIRYFAKVEGVDSVYEIEGDILGQLSYDPLHYRDRTLEKLPTGAQVISLKLIHLKDNDLSAGDEVFNGTVDPAKSGWDDLLKDKPQLIRDSVPVVLDAVRQFVVEDYRQAKFDEHYQMDLAQSSVASTGLTPVPWRYRLDAGVQLTAAGGGAATSETLTFYFSDRLTGKLRLGGTRESPAVPQAIFTLPMSLIGALGSITRVEDQPSAAVDTLRGMDQPINPRAAVPSASGSSLATPAMVPTKPADSGASESVPVAPAITPSP